MPPLDTRDFFAAFALAGLMANETYSLRSPREITRRAYEVADAAMEGYFATDNLAGPEHEDEEMIGNPA